MKITLAWSDRPIPYLGELLKAVGKTFNVSLSVQEIKISEKSYDRGRKQYNAEILLDEISGMDVPGDRVILVLREDRDIYVPEMNFVFGLAGGKYAMVSLARLDPRFYGEGDGEVLKRRMITEVIHELGHTMGLLHCDNPKCVMSFSNSIAGVDRKSPSFCKKCVEKLEIMRG
jgi:archaemetzincin